MDGVKEGGGNVDVPDGNEGMVECYGAFGCETPTSLVTLISRNNWDRFIPISIPESNNLIKDHP
jgi:hypothetical protein